jgi:hypothetical protein
MYLSEMKMMERMSSVTVRKAPLRTWVVLSEHGEKLSATIALKELHRTLTPLEKNGLTVVDACIKRVLAARKLSVKNTKLTEQDLFYREVRIYLSCIVTPSPWLHHVAMVTDIGEFS